MATPRRARVRALAKINLDLRVLWQRPDGYHELRTIFQTVSLADTLEIVFTPAPRTSISLECDKEIGDNLVTRAASACLEAMRLTGRAEFRLRKRIPMGAGLGGGSSDAAAVLLALPVLAGRPIPPELLFATARGLGSDVPFFLLGGAVAGIGRGTELFPVAEPKPEPVLVVAPGIHVSTPEAYRALGRGPAGAALTSDLLQNYIDRFQSRVWGLETASAVNDFEPVVFAGHPELGRLKRRLARLGAVPALMSGSGSSLFGVFRTQEQANHALKNLHQETILAVSLVNRARYRALWRRWLKDWITERGWPPRSRYAR